MNNVRQLYIGKIIKGKTILKLAYADNRCVSHYRYKCSCGHISVSTIANLERSKFCKNCIPRVGTFKSGDITGFRRLLNRYRYSKIGRKCFKLSVKKFRELTSSNCYYCNSLPNYISKIEISKNKPPKGKGLPYIYNGIDRLDSSKGYTNNNVVPCCGKCNKAKLDMSVKEFKEHIIKIYKHWINL